MRQPSDPHFNAVVSRVFFFGKEAALELAVYCFLPHTLLKETNETELSMYQKNGSYQKDVAQGKSTIILCTS